MAKGKKNTNAFSTVLVRLMEEHGLTVAATAKVAGVPVSTLGHWRTGHAPTDFMAVRKLAAALGVSMAYLLTGEDEEQVPARALHISDVLTDGGDLFEGILEVRIKRLVPKK